MIDDREGLYRSIATMRLEALLTAARQMREDGSNLRAAELYGQAADHAEGAGLEVERLSCLVRQAWALIAGDRLAEALVVSASILSERHDSDHRDVLFSAMLATITVMQSIPLELKAVERAYDRAESFATSAGEPHWRAPLLFLRSLLLRRRGLYVDALHAAQEALTLRREGSPHYSRAQQLDCLWWICMLLRDFDLAERYLAELEQASVGVGFSDYRMFCRSSSEFARAVGHYDDSLRWALRSEKGGIESTEATALAYLCRGDVDHARTILGACRPNRSAFSGIQRFEFRLALGFLHLAKAREAAGVSSADDEYHDLFPLPWSLLNSIEARPELARAQIAFSRAMRIGRWLDSMYEGRHFGPLAARQLARLGGAATTQLLLVD